MNIERLRVFLAVYECSSMTAAAVRLGITQPAVSQSVRELEDEVGAELFIRGRKGITPTREADRFWDAARRAVRAFEAAEHEARRLHQPSRTSLRLGATFAPSMCVLPRAMSTFALSQRDVLSSLRVLEAETLAASLRTENYDIAVVDFDPAKLDARHFETQALFLDPIVFVESTHRAGNAFAPRTIAVDELSTLPLILPPLGTMARHQLHLALEERGVAPGQITACFEMTCSAALLSAVTLGLGVGLMSHSAAASAEERGDLHVVHIEGLTMTSPVTAVRPRETVHSEVVEAFWVHLRSLSFLSPVHRACIGLDMPPSSKAG